MNIFSFTTYNNFIQFQDDFCLRHIVTNLRVAVEIMPNSLCLDVNTECCIIVNSRVSMFTKFVSVKL